MWRPYLWAVATIATDQKNDWTSDRILVHRVTSKADDNRVPSRTQLPKCYAMCNQLLFRSPKGTKDYQWHPNYRWYTQNLYDRSYVNILLHVGLLKLIDFNYTWHAVYIIKWRFLILFSNNYTNLHRFIQCIFLEKIRVGNDNKNITNRQRHIECS